MIKTDIYTRIHRLFTYDLRFASNTVPFKVPLAETQEGHATDAGRWLAGGWACPPRAWVEGEVGRLQRPTSGHVYFTLKDESRDAAVDCVMYKREAMRFGARLSEGGRVQLRGRATFYPPRGRLQWIAERPVEQHRCRRAYD